MVGLRQRAGADFQKIVNNITTGWGWPATVTNSAGLSKPLNILSNDIGSVIDANTGMVAAGREASAAMVLADLTASGLGMPVAVADKALKPWTVVFDDIELSAYTFKIASVRPDRAMGSIVCMLEEYVP